MVQHITQYKAGIFEGLALDWPAIKNWDINTNKGVEYLTDAFGDDYLISALQVDSF